jgi:hypothetical protein
VIRSLCAVALLLAFSPAVHAEEDACSTEVARLCPQSRGDLLMLGCLRANEQAFRKVCRGNLEKVLDKARSMASACDGDVQRHCKDVEPGDGRVARCLKDKEHQLSQSCQGAFNQWRVMRMELRAACAGDIGTHCKMVPEGAGRIWTCLQKNSAALSSDCRSAVNKL